MSQPSEPRPVFTGRKFFWRKMVFLDGSGLHDENLMCEPAGCIPASEPNTHGGESISGHKEEVAPKEGNQ